MAWVSPRVNSAQPWVRGSSPALEEMGRTSVVALHPHPARCSRMQHTTATPQFVAALMCCSSTLSAAWFCVQQTSARVHDDLRGEMLGSDCIRGQTCRQL